MKNSSAYGKKFSAQLKKLKRRAVAIEMTDPVEVLAYSQLLWESTTVDATEHWHNLQDAMIDWHEIRVSTPAEIAEMCGDKSDMSLDRAARLKSMVHRLFLRHHEVTMAPDLELGKREVRSAITSLDGITPFVAARWLLLCADVGDIPVDSQLVWMLVESDCIDEEATLEEVASWLSRQVKSDKAVDAYLTLQAWVDGQSAAVRKKRAGRAQAEARSAKKARTASLKRRAEMREVTKKKAAERAAKRAAEEAAKAAATEAVPELTKKTPAKKKPAAKKPPAKKTAKKTSKKTTKKVAKKTTKKTAKKVAKKTTKKTTKKTAKKVAKKTSKKTTKKVAKKTKKKTTKKTGR